MSGLEHDSFVVLCILIGLSPVGDRSVAGFWSSVLGGFNKGQWEATQSCKNGDALCKACGRKKTTVFFSKLCEHICDTCCSKDHMQS